MQRGGGRSNGGLPVGCRGHHTPPSLTEGVGSIYAHFIGKKPFFPTTQHISHIKEMYMKTTHIVAVLMVINILVGIYYIISKEIELGLILILISLIYGLFLIELFREDKR